MNNMKTNKYINMLLTGVLTGGLVACVDDNDWGTDSSYSRPFSPHDIEVSAEATNAIIEFDRLSSVDYYLLELNQDTLYLDEYHEGSRIDTVRNSPYILDKLSGETVYFIRLKAVSSAATDSKWSYYEDGEMRSFKTKGEQIFESISSADRTESSIRLSWEAGLAVTRIEVSVVDNEGGKTLLKTVTLTNEQIQEGVCVVDGLEPTTTYAFVIYNGDSKRGERTATTAAAMPEGDLKYTLEEGTTLISTDMIKELVAQAQSATGNTSVGVTIGIPAGVTVDMYGVSSETGEQTTLSISDGASVTFFGLAGAEKPVLNFAKTLEIGGTHSYIRFENVVIKDGGAAYLINQANEMKVDEISFKDCEMSSLSRSLVRLQGSSTKIIGTVNIDNCVVTDQGSGNYAFLYWNNAAYTVSSVNIKNSTFNTMKHSFADIRNSATGSFNVSNCTFYNVVANGRYFLDAQNVNVAVTIQNSIFGKTFGDGVSSKVNGLRLSGTSTFLDMYKTSDCAFASGFNSDRGESPVVSTDLFSDPDAGNFTVLVNSLKGLGDPRWNNE